MRQTSERKLSAPGSSELLPFFTPTVGRLQQTSRDHANENRPQSDGRLHAGRCPPLARGRAPREPLDVRAARTNASSTHISSCYHSGGPRPARRARYPALYRGPGAVRRQPQPRRPALRHGHQAGQVRACRPVLTIGVPLGVASSLYQCSPGYHTKELPYV